MWLDEKPSNAFASLKSVAKTFLCPLLIKSANFGVVLFAFFFRLSHTCVKIILASRNLC